jgi:hypothetical protein
VGAGLTRLSALRGLTLRMYAVEVLPRVLAEVAACRDEIAQGYLLECLIQVSSEYKSRRGREPRARVVGGNVSMNEPL